MFIDYSERVDELLDFITREMGVPDRQGVSICLAIHLPPESRSQFPPAWISLNTHMTSVSGSWFTFGWNRAEEVHAKTVYLANLKAIRPRYSNPKIQSILQARQLPKLFVDSSFMSGQKILMRHAYYDLAPKLLRLNVDAPFSHIPDQNKMSELRRLADRCLNLEFRDVYPRQYKPNEQFLAGMKILTRINPDLHEWDQIYQNLSMVISAHAALYGRDVPEEADLLAGMRVLRNSVRWREMKVLSPLIKRDGWILKSKLREITGFELPELGKICNHLVQSGALKRTQNQFAIADPLLREFLDGSALTFLGIGGTKKKRLIF